MIAKTVVFFLLFAACIGFADNASPYPLFYYDIVASAAQNDLSKGKIDIFFEVVYDDVQFTKTAVAYDAAYELSAIILDGREQVNGDLWKETLSVDTFDKTNSRRDISLTHKTFTLAPGKYTVKLNYEDLNSSQTYAYEEKIEIDNYAKPAISGSEITFARQVTLEDGKIKSLFPEVTSAYKGLGHPAFAYFEVYNPAQAESATLDYEIRGENTKVEIEKTMNIELSGERTGISIPLPTDSLAHDRYVLGIDITANRKKAHLEKTFYVRWAGLPRSTADLETAIQQLQYIATSKEWKKLKKAPESQQLEYFIDFWDKRDPTPGSEQNEAMQSYYARVDAANQEFTVMSREGWTTDRGLVFIILGPPDEIIRNNYPSGTRPFQVWQYYSINRQFEFYDRNGFGDYEFVYPLSISELQRFAQRQQ